MCERHRGLRALEKDLQKEYRLTSDARRTKLVILILKLVPAVRKRPTWPTHRPNIGHKGDSLVFCEKTSFGRALLGKLYAKITLIWSDIFYQYTLKPYYPKNNKT